MDSFYENTLEKGGEGIVLAKAESQYEFKRSSNQWKRTPVFTAEAIVVDYTAGTGKHEGRVGALIVSQDRKSFKVGTGLTDAEREDPPPIGSAITYSYKGSTKAGLPRHPAYIAVRDYE
jgi:DNA ligase-1